MVALEQDSFVGEDAMPKLSYGYLKIAAMGAAVMASVSMGSLAASAADVVTAEPIDQWSGLYLGGQVGYLQGNVSNLEFCLDDGFCPPDDGFNADANPDGVTAGGYLGYNFRFDSLLLGVEGDINWDNAKDSTVICCISNLESELTWDASIRARLGLIIDESALLYITGGPSWIHEKINVFGSSDSQTPMGWQLGVGGEFFVTRHLSTKLEYLHAWYGSDKFDGDCGQIGCSIKADLETDVVRAGIAYHFNGN
jgi:outer membrane immunogenic protein